MNHGPITERKRRNADASGPKFGGGQQCPHCGAECDDDFCENCGKDISNEDDKDDEI
jgi:predicted amidophosphoribosyltransferase